MIIRKNKRVVFSDKETSAAWVTDKVQQWHYCGNNKSYGNRYIAYTEQVSGRTRMINKNKLASVGPNIQDV